MIDQDRAFVELLDRLPAIRWPDPISPVDEMVAAVLSASPTVGRQYLQVVKLCLGRASTEDQLVTFLYEAGAYLGAHGGAELGALCWGLADAVTASINEQEVEQ